MLNWTWTVEGISYLSESRLNDGSTKVNGRPIRATLKFLECLPGEPHEATGKPGSEQNGFALRGVGAPLPPWGDKNSVAAVCENCFPFFEVCCTVWWGRYKCWHNIADQSMLFHHM